MKGSHRKVLVGAAVVLLIGADAAALCPGQGCAPDAVAVGPLCMDKYEASVWQVPAGASNAGLITKIKQGTVTLAELAAGGATQVSPSSSCTPGFPATFPLTGQWTEPLYAVSIAGVHPTGRVSWFQAAQACRLAGKRLPTNAEWQDAAAGTPDPGDADDHSTTCNTHSADVANTGSRGSCRSSWGVFDMVGNVHEWVADWGPRADGCTDWKTQLGFTDGDSSCMGNLGNTSSRYHIPGALVRGGFWISGSGAGVFAVFGNGNPYTPDNFLGFRCAR
jgi:formylglycine-generating enzyme required for sulfatase activity